MNPLIVATYAASTYACDALTRGEVARLSTLFLILELSGSICGVLELRREDTEIGRFEGHQAVKSLCC